MTRWLLPILFLWLPQTFATTLLYKTFDELIMEADGIIIGTVTDIQAHVDETGDIYTFVMLNDLDIIYGDFGGKEFTIRLEGGQIENQGLHVVGSPDFRRKERVVLFVTGNGREIVPLVGWSQGLYRVSTDQKYRRDVITDSDGNRVFGIQNGHLVKEYRVPSEAEIIAAPAPVHPYSKPAEGSVIGDAAGREIVQPAVNKTIVDQKQPMELRDFTREIKQRASARKVSPSPLISVDVSEKIQIPEGIDATPRSVEEPEHIKQIPASKESPGEAPKRIDIGAERPKAEAPEKTVD